MSRSIAISAGSLDVVRSSRRAAAGAGAGDDASARRASALGLGGFADAPDGSRAGRSGGSTAIGDGADPDRICQTTTAAPTSPIAAIVTAARLIAG
jgi:hypothetical protein